MEMIVKIKQRVLELVSQQTDRSLTEEDWHTPLVDLGVDSLMALELAVYLEREFHFRLTESELASIKTLEDILKAIEPKVNGAQS